jgi:hypothetical protein
MTSIDGKELHVLPHPEAVREFTPFSPIFKTSPCRSMAVGEVSFCSCLNSVNLLFHFFTGQTDDAPKMTEQTKIHISSCFSAMMAPAI